MKISILSRFAPLLVLACHCSAPAKDYRLESAQGADLLKGTTVHLHFGDGSLSVQADCNDIGGSYEVRDGRVVVGNLMQTEMGCDEKRHAQDDWLGAFFRSKPRLTAGDQRLTFASASARLVFVERELAGK